MAKGKDKKQEKLAEALAPIADEAATVAASLAATVTPATARHSSGIPKGFSLDAPKLPNEIDDAAMRSGGYPYDKRMKREDFRGAASSPSDRAHQASEVQPQSRQPHSLSL